MINQAVRVLDGEKAYNIAGLDQHLLGIQKIMPKQNPFHELHTKRQERHKYFNNKKSVAKVDKRLTQNEENMYLQYSNQIEKLTSSNPKVLRLEQKYSEFKA